MEERLRGLFRRCGYQEIETPAIEFYDVFHADAGLIPQEAMFKFTDPQGRLLVLKPDNTIPVARVAATKYRDGCNPLRLSYISDTYRFNEYGGGKQREFTQAGVEILGANTPEADAEIIATAIQALKTAGLENFQIDIGQVEFFKGLMEQTGLDSAAIEQMRVLIDKKDFLGVEELVRKNVVEEELGNLILNLPKLFGTIDVIERVEKIPLNRRSLAALANLREILRILEDYELSGYVSIDLGMVQSLNYYTGIIFRGFTYGVGFPVLSGGRYDNLVEKFGKCIPATGFSAGIQMLMTALERQKVEMEKPGVDTLVCYTAGGRKTAFQLCEELRKQGLSVEMDILSCDLAQAKEYAACRGIGGILRITGKEDIEVYDLQSGSVAQTTFQQLLSR